MQGLDKPWQSVLLLRPQRLLYSVLVPTISTLKKWLLVSPWLWLLVMKPVKDLADSWAIAHVCTMTLLKLH